MAAVPVAVFADFTCPFSYVTEAALWRLEDEGRAAPRYHAFELFPAPAPLPAEGSGADLRAALPLAEAEGVELAAPPPPARTRKAHETARFAAEKGLERAVRRALYAAAFADGRDVGRIDVLRELAGHVGLDPYELHVALGIDAHTDAVLRDEAAARRLGVEGVPALVIGAGARARLLVGAHGYDALRRALEAAAE